MAAVAGALRDGAATEEDLARLRRWSVVLRGRGACATLDAATNVAASLLAKFPDVVQSHLHNGCQTCQLGAFTADRPYQVEAVSQV
jgi:NADH:ubiquinone oxidoreductase subunit F (NADH-binding)